MLNVSISIARNLSFYKPAFYRLKMENFNVVFVLGAPGAGKGTQCEKIAQVCTLSNVGQRGLSSLCENIDFILTQCLICLIDE